MSFVLLLSTLLAKLEDAMMKDVKKTIYQKRNKLRYSEIGITSDFDSLIIGSNPVTSTSVRAATIKPPNNYGVILWHLRDTIG